MLCYVIVLINFNLILTNSDSTKELSMIVVQKFMELDAEVYVVRVRYIRQ